MKIGLFTAAVMVLLVAGCSTDPELTDEDWIEQLVTSSGFARSSNLDGTGDPTDGKDGADVELPEHWYRQIITDPAPQVIIEDDPAAGICTVTVVHSITASLLIDVEHDGVWDPGTKPIADTRVVRLALERNDNQEEYGGWFIVAATPAEHMLTGSGQEVFISSMRLYQDDQLIWECTDPETFYDVQTGHPVLQEGDFVRMEATVDHLDPQYEPAYFVVAHGPLSGHSRHMMFDNGLYGDRVAGDGIYTYEWYVEYTAQHQRIAVDVIDADTFADQTENDYDSGAWGIRYLK